MEILGAHFILGPIGLVLLKGQINFMCSLLPHKKQMHASFLSDFDPKINLDPCMFGFRNEVTLSSLKLMPCSSSVCMLAYNKSNDATLPIKYDDLEMDYPSFNTCDAIFVLDG